MEAAFIKQQKQQECQYHDNSRYNHQKANNTQQ